MAKRPYFQVVCVLGKRVVVTAEYWDKIIRFKHPILAGKEDEVKQTLEHPDQIRQSKSDAAVKLYYRAYDSRHLCIVVKHTNGSGFIVTGYFTDKIKEGTNIWTKL